MATISMEFVFGVIRRGGSVLRRNLFIGIKTWPFLDISFGYFVTIKDIADIAGTFGFVIIANLVIPLIQNLIAVPFVDEIADFCCRSKMCKEKQGKTRQYK